MEQKESRTLQHVKVKSLKASPWNRASDKNGEMGELVDSVKMHGILQPLIARVVGGETPYEIVAGHRRWTAAKAAGLEEVPVLVVLHMTDQDAKLAQITENLQRKNLNPMEEARAFEHLRGENHTAQTIADMAAKDVKYVHRSLELLTLPKKAQAALEGGLITAAHGHQLARIGPTQIEALTTYAITKGYKGDVPTLTDLKAEIGRRVEKKLSQAPFEKDKPYAGKVACVGCPKNTGNQDVLFDDAQEGYCTFNTCFAAKLKQFYKDLQTKGEQKWPNLKFIGTASSSYNETQTIKGYEVVEAADPKVKKAIEFKAKDPKANHNQVEGYGFGIVKPSNWGTSKVAKLVVLKQLPKGQREKSRQEGYQGPSDEERAQAEFLQNYVNREVAITVFTKAVVDQKMQLALVLSKLDDSYAIRRHAKWLNAAGIEIVKGKTTINQLHAEVKKLPVYSILKLCFWLENENALEFVADQNDIDLAKEKKVFAKLAKTAWEKDKVALVAAYKERYK